MLWTGLLKALKKAKLAQIKVTIQLIFCFQISKVTKLPNNNKFAKIFENLTCVTFPNSRPR